MFQPEPLRDGVQHFCEKHLSTIRNFISSLSARIPLPTKCSIVGKYTEQNIEKNFELRFMNIFLSISLNICFGCAKEPSH